MESGPDGGLWGWLAVLGCFMGNVIGDGLMYRWGETNLFTITSIVKRKRFCFFTLMFSFGVFLPKFKEHFQVGSAEISTVNAIQV